MKILVTGHTGFKGAWLSSYLTMLGHQVHGISNSVPQGGLFEVADVGSHLAGDLDVDIRDTYKLERVIADVQPEIVVHLAAQPLVRDSYEMPHETFEINAQGTVNVLKAIQKNSPDSYLLAITTDKVYLNTSKLGGYTELDPLGASDPYSTSKAMADLALQSWALSFPGKPRLAIARAGNVIGPLDVSFERLVPDIERAINSKEILSIRFPEATRPWQYVLDCLAGYLDLIEKRESTWGGIWNFGPLPSHEKSVAQVVSEARKIAPFEIEFNAAPLKEKPEHGLLTLDSQKAREALLWSDKVNFQDAIRYSLELGKKLRSLSSNDAWLAVLSHIDVYQSL